MPLPNTIDPECIIPCRAMNRLPGITTVESCCDHNKRAFKIWFVVDNLAALPPLLYWIDS